MWLIDFARPENNELLVVNQLTVVENQQKKRLDLVLFVKSMPLVLIELKNATDEPDKPCISMVTIWTRFWMGGRFIACLSIRSIRGLPTFRNAINRNTGRLR